ncbi:MAG: hypothetical protein QOH69_402 [Actinomycetota bacterium]|jgi:hypothetical protein|nr:hypothetical protein [Actinomycetota bacterium]
MNRIVSTTLIGTTAVVALLAGSCAPAFADGTSTPAPAAGKSLSAIQAEAKIKTTARIGALNTAIAKVNAAQDITSADRTTILGTLNGDLAGMNTVEAKIAGDTTALTAAADYKTIFTTYRVYAVAIPQSRLAAAADRMTSTSIPRLTDAQSKLAAALAGPDASKSTPELQADLADMSAQIASATSALNGTAAQALAVTPSAFNSNHAVLQPVRSAIKAAIADLKKAAADGKTVLAAIK